MPESIMLGVMIIIFSILFGFTAIILILVWLRSQRFRLRDPLNKKRYIEDFWMIEKLDKPTGILYWKSVFWQRKLKIPEPPKIDQEIRAKKKTLRRIKNQHKPSITAIISRALPKRQSERKKRPERYVE